MRTNIREISNDLHQPCLSPPRTTNDAHIKIVAAFAKVAQMGVWTLATKPHVVGAKFA